MVFLCENELLKYLFTKNLFSPAKIDGFTIIEPQMDEEMPKYLEEILIVCDFLYTTNDICMLKALNLK